jgi:hypothetical protein
MLISTLVIVLVVVLIGSRLSSRVEFIATPPEEVSDACVQHFHSYWHLRWGAGDEWFQFIPRYEKLFHVWECTSEKCPIDGQTCERVGHGSA